MTSSKHILVCACASAGVVSKPALETVVAVLREANTPVTLIPDLCRLSAERDSRLVNWADGNLIVVACHERAVRNLFLAAGVPEQVVAGIEFISAAGLDAETILDKLGHGLSMTALSTQLPEDDDKSWVPWFPVIDSSRCSNCGQCRSFCLFDVYDVDETGQVVVSRPHNCKNNCPACARICPQVAIIFPKYGESPINGAEVTDEAAEQDRIRVDLEQLLGKQDIYEALAARRKKRKTPLFKEEAREQALAERSKCLEEQSNCNCSGEPDSSCCNESEVVPAEATSGCDCDCECGPDSECCNDCEVQCYDRQTG